MIMKKILFTLIFAGIMAFSAQSQTYFAGGTLGFDYKASKSESYKGPATTSFELSPMLGYYLREDVGVGVMLTLGNSTWKSRYEGGSSKESTFDWGFSPFIRYTLLTRGDFSILAQGSMGVYGHSKKDGPNTFGFGIDAMPLLSYSLTDKVSLEVSSGLARFGFSVESQKSGSGEYKSKSSETSFGFGVDSRNFFSSPYQIGLIYKF